MLGESLMLSAVYLDLTCITGTLQITGRRASLALFLPTGELLLAVTQTDARQRALIGAWRFGRWANAAVRAVGMTRGSDDAYPLIRFSHRRWQVRGQLRRLGPFWLAEAQGEGLSVSVDDGEQLTVARRHLGGQLRLRSYPSKL